MANEQKPAPIRLAFKGGLYFFETKRREDMPLVLARPTFRTSQDAFAFARKHDLEDRIA